MQIKRGDHTANQCRLTLDVSWETARALSELLPELAMAVQRATGDHLEYTISREATRVDLAEKAKHRRATLFAIGRMASAELRRRLTNPETPSAIRTATVIEIAHRNDINPGQLEALLKRHGKALRLRLRRLRNARIIRLYIEGQSNGQIAGQFGIHRGTVAQIIKKHRHQVAERRRERMHVVADGADHETSS